MENASKSNASSDVVSTAMRLGIKVMNVNELERYVDRYKKKSMDGCGGGGNVNDDVNKSYGTRNENNNGSLLKKDLNGNHITPSNILYSMCSFFVCVVKSTN